MAAMTKAEEVNRMKPDPLVPQLARVGRRRRETHDTWTLELDPSPDYPGFAPAQFDMLYVMGVGEIPISVSSDPAQGRLAHTIRAAGPVSKALVGLKRGDTLGLRGPFGSAWPLAEAKGKDVVVMAGGLGIAPLRPLLYRLFAEPQAYGRLCLLYGTRSPAHVLYARELERWREKGRARVEITVDHASTDWSGPVGVVTDLIHTGLFDPDHAVAFVCGPEVMMRFSISTLMAKGLPPAAIHLSMERNMKCAVGHCGHCQFGPAFICKDGPVLRFDRVQELLGIKEI